jgi:hypothetical protein
MTPAVGKLLEIRSANKPEQNGLYIITSMGSSSTKWVLTRTTPVLQATVLYSGYHGNLTDSGIFVAKVKKIIDREDSVYDLSVRMSIENNKRIFQIYLNNENIGAVTDPDPVARLNENVSLFTRGSSKIMFENVFALDTTGYDSINESSKDKSLFNIFNDSLTSNIEFNRYSLNNLLISGFLSRINANTANTNTVFYEEFGSIMREVGYINAKFNIYPALRSMVSPTPASIGGWFVTGYNSTPYRAEFLIFNTTDFVLTFGDNKDATSNLNISGITFTEEVASELTVDNYYNNMIQSSREQNSPTAATFKTNMTDIKNNRLAYGSKAFSIDSPYIQNQEMAEDLMSWIIEKVSKPRKAVAVQTFGMPIIQLGDIVDFYYDQTKTKPNGITGSRFVVYGIEHDTAENGPSTILYLSEVV